MEPWLLQETTASIADVLVTIAMNAPTVASAANRPEGRQVLTTAHALDSGVDEDAAAAPVDGVELLQGGRGGRRGGPRARRGNKTISMLAKALSQMNMEQAQEREEESDGEQGN